jgi:FKBP-type peptidyl-prolyl cis-trans isomerase 2
MGYSHPHSKGNAVVIDFDEDGNVVIKRNDPLAGKDLLEYSLFREYKFLPFENKLKEGVRSFLKATGRKLVGIKF